MTGRQEEEVRKNNSISKETFFSIIAHDLKNPINAIIGLSDLLYNDFEDFSPEESKEVIYQIKHTSQNIYDLFEKMVQWFKSQSGTLNMYKEEFKAYEAIESAMDYCEAASMAKHIKIDYKVDDELMVYADVDMIRTILLNLITNAIKFTHKGGNISITAVEDGNYVRFDVSDTGVGIPKDILDTLFIINEDKVRKGTQNENGTGIGLLVCHDFVKMHDGRISVLSKEQEGTTFSFTIPQK